MEILGGDLTNIQLPPAVELFLRCVFAMFSVQCNKILIPLFVQTIRCINKKGSVLNLDEGIMIVTNARPQNKRKYKRVMKDNKDRGISHRLEYIHEKGRVDPDNVHEEEFESAEGDFMNLEQSYEQHIQEINEGLQRKGKFAMMRKHFRQEKLPSMLTYFEKEQIKVLHKQHPDEWTYDKLADSFPATPNVIKKIIKSEFKASSISAIMKHDQRVRRNWKLFMNSKLIIKHEDLQIHLAKFTNRCVEYSEKEYRKMFPNVGKRVPFKTVCKEFEDIIDDFKKQRGKKNMDIVEEEDGKVRIDGFDGKIKAITEDHNSNLNVQHYTLDKFKEEITEKPIQKEEMDKLIAAPSKRNRDLLLEGVPLITSHHYLEDTGVVSGNYAKMVEKSENEEDEMEHNYPMRISIPLKHQFGESKLFRVKDRFYYEDGDFLFRVPGIEE